MVQSTLANPLGFLIFLLACSLEISKVTSFEVCNTENFEAVCTPEEVVVMTSVQYGRKRIGRCITNAIEIGCVNNVLPLFDKLCSGKNQCSVPIPSPELEELNTACSEYLKLSLEATYDCIKVESACSESSPNLITKSNGYISSQVTTQTGCGSLRSPWVISLSPGQTVNITLIDFQANDKNRNVFNNYISCKYVYGYILERALGINHTICGGGVDRQVALYLSKTNSVEIFLTQQRTNLGEYLLRFQTMGCPDIIRHEHAWYKREGNTAVIGCETNNLEWRLVCKRNAWEGTVGNCTEESEIIATKPSSTFTLDFNSVVMMAGIACGAIVIVVISVMSGVIYLKKYKMKQETRQMQKTYATLERNAHAYYRPVSADQSFSNQSDGPKTPFLNSSNTPPSNHTWQPPMNLQGRHLTNDAPHSSCMLSSFEQNRGVFLEPNYASPEFDL